MLIRFNKPFQVLCQFTDENARQTLADFIDIPNIYAAGRLDKDSEGLLLLTDDGKLQNRISDPKHKQPKTYCVQVDGEPSDASLAELRRGVQLKDGKTRPPTSWIQLTLTEGRNRQVRRMTAAVNHPTLRLIRTAIGNIKLDGLSSGTYEEINASKL